MHSRSDVPTAKSMALNLPLRLSNLGTALLSASHMAMASIGDSPGSSDGRTKGTVLSDPEEGANAFNPAIPQSVAHGDFDDFIRNSEVDYGNLDTAIEQQTRKARKLSSQLTNTAWRYKPYGQFQVNLQRPLPAPAVGAVPVDSRLRPMLLRHQTKKRLMMVPNREANDNSPLEDYQTQLMLSEQQNRRRR